MGSLSANWPPSPISVPAAWPVEESKNITAASSYGLPFKLTVPSTVPTGGVSLHPSESVERQAIVENRNVDRIDVNVL